MTIVEELRQNRESGAKRLEAEYKAGLMTLARRFCADESDATELVNRTFAAVVEGIDRYLEQSAFFGWMCQILSNIHAKDCRNKANGIVVYPGEVPELADEAAGEAIFRDIDRSLLREAVDALPKDQRESVVLHYFLDIPIPKIAKILAVPGGTVKSRLHYARLALAAKLGVAAKKPGVKALLIALALAALTAAGAASSLAVVRLLSQPPGAQEQQAHDGKDAAQEQQAHDIKGDDEMAYADIFGVEAFPFVFPPTTLQSQTMKNRTFLAAASAALLPLSGLSGLVSDDTLVLVDDAMPGGYFSNVATGEKALSLTGTRSGNQYFARRYDDKPAAWLADGVAGAANAVTNENSHYINGIGTCATIGDSTPSYALSDFTFETFFKQAANAPGYQYYRYIFRQPNAWALRVVNNWLYLVDMVGNTTVSGGAISDGKWHHIAVVQDRSAGTMSLYVDYAKKGALTYVVDAANGTPGTPSFSGWADGATVKEPPQQAYYDAIRLTATALKPEEFLMSGNMAARLQGGDLLAYLGLDSALGQDSPAFSWLSAVYKANPDTCEFVEGVGELYPSSAATSTFESSGALHLAKGDLASDFKSGGFKVADSAPSFTGYSFTAELFFKATVASATQDSYIFAHENAWNVWVTKTGLLYGAVKGHGETIGYSTNSIVDGQWHHIAFVWNKEAHEAEFWLDYRRLGKTTGLDSILVDGKAAAPTLFIGGFQEWDYGLRKAFGDVCFDEIRLTARALGKMDFLTRERFKEQETLVLFR